MPTSSNYGWSLAALSDAQFNSIFSDCDVNVRRCIRSEISYDLDGWINHGGPSPVVSDQIRALMNAQLQQDTTGLKVRLSDGEIHFSHQTAVYLLNN